MFKLTIEGHSENGEPLIGGKITTLEPTRSVYICLGHPAITINIEFLIAKNQNNLCIFAC